MHSLRTRQGKFELGARIVARVFFAVVWLGAGTGCGVLAHQIAADGQLLYLPALLWPLFLMWQVVPIMLSAAQESVDFNFLLRFPITFRSYVLLYLAFGIFDPSSMLGGICMVGIWIGVVSAVPSLAIWTAVALALFALFNFLLTRTIFAWIERWLAQRKTREILGIVALCVFLGFQLLNPAMRAHHGHSPAIDQPAVMHALRVVQAVQIVFPPGLAGDAIAAAAKGSYPAALGLLGAVTLYLAGVGALLGMRLRAEYRGEQLGEAPMRARAQAHTPRQRSGPAMASTTGQNRRVDGPVGAILVKELRYLSRSGVMLFGLFAPLVLIFAMGGPMRGDSGFSMQYAFPFAVAYGFLPLSRQFCNSLGTEGAGIQLYFLSPTPFRDVMLAKNVLQAGLFCAELALVGSIAVFRFGPPSSGLALATFCWVLFALPANLAAGNVLSITLAYRMTLTRVSREQGSVGNGLLSLLIQLTIFAVGVAVYLPLAILHHAGFAAPIFVALAGGSVMVWLRILTKVDRMANLRREALMSVLVRPA